MQANLATLETLNTQLRLNSDNQIRAAERRRLPRPCSPRPRSSPARACARTATEPRAVRLTRLRQELASARTLHTDAASTVIRLKAEIAATERDARPSPLAAEPARPQLASSPYVMRLREPLSAAETEAQDPEDRGAAAQPGHRHLPGPGREHARASRSSRRSRGTTNRRSSSTDRCASGTRTAQLAESMEQRQKGEQFRMLDPAVPRHRPRPNRVRLLLVTLVLSARPRGRA